MKIEVKPGETVFVDMGGSYLKAKVKEVQKDDLVLELRDGTKFLNPNDKASLEKQVRQDQRFAFADIKRKLLGAYVSWDKLSEVDRNDLASGKEVLYKNRYLKKVEGSDIKIPKEIAKVLHLTFDGQNNATVLKVHNRNEKELKLEEREYFHHKFSKEEIKKLEAGETIIFEGNSNDGEVFKKAAYIDRDLNDLRIKGVLTDKTVFYGQNLTAQQADVINKGGNVEITIDTSKGKKTYEVGFDFKRNSFTTKGLDKEKINNINTSFKPIIADEKKNNSEKKTSGKNAGMAV